MRMKLQHKGWRIFLSLGFFLLFCAGVVTAQSEKINLGKYWINIVQTGEDSYNIKLEINASENMEVRVVRVPVFVDASLIPASIEVRPLETARLEVPVSFTGKGQGDLKISCVSLQEENRSQFIVFRLFNSVRGSQVKESLQGAADLISRSGGSQAVIQLAGKVNPVKKSLIPALLADSAFAETSALRGISFYGISKNIDGDSLKINSLQEESLKLDVSKAGRIASFISVGSLPPLEKTQQSADSAVNVKVKENKTSPPPEKKISAGKEVAAETTKTQNGVKKADPKPRSGPFVAESNSVTVPRLAVRKDWSADKSGAGHFVEVPLILPQECLRAKRIDEVKLVLKIYPEGNRNAAGRVFISNKVTLETTGVREEDYWMADKVKFQGKLLGEFDTEYDGNEFSFNITDWLEEDGGDRAFISILNLSRSPLEIKGIKLVVKGDL